MAEKKFGIFALLVILLSIGDGECRGGFSSFFGGLAGVAVGKAIGKLAKPKPKQEVTYLYQSVPQYGSPPMYNPQQYGPGAPINPVNVQNTHSAPPMGYNPGTSLQNKPAYPGQQPIGVVRNSSPARAFILHPSFYGFIGIATYFLGKGYRLIV